MPGLTPELIADLVNATRNAHVDEDLVDLMSSIQDHVLVRTLVTKHMEEGDGGTKTEFSIITDENGSAQDAPMFYQRNPNIVDVTKRGQVSYSRQAANYTLEQSEVPLNGREAKIKIFSIRAARRGPALLSLHNKIETAGWSKPADSTVANAFLGVKSWIVKNVSGTSAAAQNGGFNGGDPSGFSSGIGGISSTVVPQYANWAHQYSAVTPDDLGMKLTRMRFMTNFRSSVAPKVPGLSTHEPKRGYYMNPETAFAMERYLRLQNDNIGKDWMFAEGEGMIGKTPIVPVPQLAADTENPIYQIDWSWMRFIRQPGMGWLDENAHPLSDRPTTIVSDIMTPWWQLICINRRAQGVLSTAASITT